MHLKAGAAVVSFALCLAAGAAAQPATRPAQQKQPTKQECVAAFDKAQEAFGRHKLNDARAAVAVCLDPSCGKVTKDCDKLLGDVSAAQPSVVFGAKDGAGNDLTAVRLFVDGAPLADKLDGTALDVDPGEHLFRFEAEGAPPVEKKLVIREGEKNRAESIVLAAPPPALQPPPPAPAATAKPTAARPPPSPAPAGKGMSKKRIAGIALTAAGGVAVVVGAVFGGVAISQQSASGPNCGHHGDPDLCNQDGVDQRSAMLTNSYASTGMIIGGGALAVAGIALIATSGSPSSRLGLDGVGAGGPAPAARPDRTVALRIAPGGIVLSGSW